MHMRNRFDVVAAEDIASLKSLKIVQIGEKQVLLLAAELDSTKDHLLAEALHVTDGVIHRIMKPDNELAVKLEEVIAEVEAEVEAKLEKPKKDK